MVWKTEKKGLVGFRRTEDLLYLTDSESLLKTIRKWTDEGTRANLDTTPDDDLVREIVQILQERAR